MSLPGTFRLWSSTDSARFLRLVIWVGLAYGLLEGSVSTILASIPGMLTWRDANSAPILFVAPVVYALVFLILSLPVAWIPPKIPSGKFDRWWLSGLASLSFYCLASLDGRLFSNTAALVIAAAAGVQTFRLLSRRERFHRLVDRTFLPLVGLVLLLGIAVVGGSRAWEAWNLSRLPSIDHSRPNVLLLVMDTERADHLSAYGYSKRTTPRLDSLARHATLFERAFSSAPWTLPSHASMMTGRAAREHGAGTATPWYLDANFPTIAEAMHDAGYATGGFVSNLFWTGRSTRLNRGFVHYADYFGNPADALNRTIAGRLILFPALARFFHQTDIPGRRRAPAINRQLLDWVDGLSGRPFFAFLNYNDVHQPYRPPSQTAGRFGSAVEAETGDAVEIGAWDEDKSVPPEPLLENAIARYDESLFAMDRAIGVLLDQLEARHMLENTLVIVVADHGEHFGEHGIMGHGQSVLAVETRVPLIIKDLGPLKGGSRVTSPVSTTDLPATIADRVGLAPGSFPGASLLSPTPGRPGPVLSEVQSRIRPKGFRSVKLDVAESLVDGDWHFIKYGSGKIQLFPQTKRMREVRDYADSASARSLIDRFEQELSRLPKGRWSTPPRSR